MATTSPHLLSHLTPPPTYITCATATTTPLVLSPPPPPLGSELLDQSRCTVVMFFLPTDRLYTLITTPHYLTIITPTHTQKVLSRLTSSCFQYNFDFWFSLPSSIQLQLQHFETITIKTYLVIPNFFNIFSFFLHSNKKLQKLQNLQTPTLYINSILKTTTLYFVDFCITYT